jgi:hypothetical protein
MIQIFFAAAAFLCDYWYNCLQKELQLAIHISLCGSVNHWHKKKNTLLRPLLMRVTCAQTPLYVTKAGLCTAIRLTIDFGCVPGPAHGRRLQLPVTNTAVLEERGRGPSPLYHPSTNTWRGAVIGANVSARTLYCTPSLIHCKAVSALTRIKTV